MTGSSEGHRSSRDLFPDRWLAVSCLLPPPGEELFAVEGIAELGGRIAHRDGGRLVAYFSPPGEGRDAEEAARLAGEVEVRVQAATSLEEPEVQWWWASAEEGPGVESATPGPSTIRISPTLVVERTGEGTDRGAHASGERRQGAGPDRGELVVRLAPGLGFGDAEHPTTRAALRHLEEVLSPGERVLDLGSGSGVLAVTAGLLGAEAVLAVERDPYACRAAVRNVEDNRVQDRVEVREATVEPGDLKGNGPFRGILANVVPAILLPLLPELARELAPGGWLVVAGASGGERARVLDAALAAGCLLEREGIDQGWWSATFRAR